jgi:hypothetical protein
LNDQIEPADAARALSEISRRREQAIRRTAIPRWFWWAAAVLTIASAADADYSQGRGALYWAGVALTAAGMLAVNGLLLSRQSRSPTLSPDLVTLDSGPRLLALSVAIWPAVAGVTLGTGLGLEAARVPYPATIATAVGMAVLVAGGQVLMRYRLHLLAPRPGGRG